MKIMQMHTRLSSTGGIESMIVGLSNEIVKHNHVSVCAIIEPEPNSVFYTRFSSEIKRTQLGIQKDGFSIKTLWRVFRFLSKTNADIVHIHGFFYYYALPIILFHRRLKFVYTFHSDAFMENITWDKRLLWLKRFFLKHHWLNPVTISTKSKDSFTKLYKLESRLIYNGIPFPKVQAKPNLIDELRITEKTRVFIHPGRISEAKNQVVLCKVFKKLIDEGEDVVLVIAGAKQILSIYQKLERFFCDRIVYIGDRNDVPELMARADGFCLSSLWEGLPITLLEALSVGCIPICTPVGGITDVIVSGQNGLLSKSSSYEDYYDTMRLFLTYSQDDICTMKEVCLLSSVKFNIEQTAEEYLVYYRDILSECATS